MSAFPDYVYDGPMILSPLKLKVTDFEFCGFPAAQPTAQQDGHQCAISLALQSAGIRNLPEGSCLVGSEPSAKADVEGLRPSYTSDCSRQVRAEQAGISGVVCEAPPYKRWMLAIGRCPPPLHSNPLGSRQAAE
jgi:hypothetical protein